MNATKRKFNSLLQGLNSPQRNSSSPSASETIAEKRRRLGLPEVAMPSAISPTLSTGGGTASSKLPLAPPSQTSLRKISSHVEIATRKEIAARYCPLDREQLLRRLASFQELTDWTPKPDRVSEVEWAKRGWVCQGKERVRCVLCHKELVVKLNRKEEDGKQVTVLIASEIETALVDKYVELMVSSHQPDCLWKKRGCDDSLLRISFANATMTLEALRKRYDELCSRQSFLPYEFNLRLPDDFALDTVLQHLPPYFFTQPAPVGGDETPNRAALALAIVGWQGLSNTRIGAVPNTASCATCLRRLGLWMFKSKEVDESGKVVVEAPMDHLDPIREHRFFCPWKNPEAQIRSSHPDKDELPAWQVLIQMIKNESDLRGFYSNSRARKNTVVAAGTPAAEQQNEEQDQAHLSTDDGPDLSITSFDDKQEEAERDAKDKERWARLRKVKSLFDTKGSRRLRNKISSRPGTPDSRPV